MSEQDVYEVVIETRNIRTGQRVRQTYWRTSAPTVNTVPGYKEYDYFQPVEPPELLWIDTGITFRAEPDPEHGNEIGRYER